MVLNGVVDSVPPDRGCEVLDAELTHEQWDKKDSDDFADSDDVDILLNWRGVIIECYKG